MTATSRQCPLCNCKSSGSSFPYAICFDRKTFYYFRCCDCRTVFVDPVPDAKCFELMYAKTNYHDCYYAHFESAPYLKAVALLSQFAQPGSSILDYGCGVGAFLSAAKGAGFVPYGVEFDASAASSANSISACPVFSLDDFDSGMGDQLFDVIHLGDVLEHLPDPSTVLAKLLQRLKSGGLLFVEGPLEVNPSLVYWSAKSFGALKHHLWRASIGPGVPTHLFRTSAHAQSRFFRERFPALCPLFWEVSETGWPYAQGNSLKKWIAYASLFLGGKRFLGIEFGNRFQALYKYMP